MTEKLFYSGFMCMREFYPYIREMPYRLFSCHNSYLSIVEKTARINSQQGIRLDEIILDSGAFTAWSKGDHITVQEVAENFHRAMNYFNGQVDKIWLINLDVIPGSRGNTATLDEIKKAMADSDVNQKRLQDYFGDRVLPVFHQDEPWERLDEVMALACDKNYICVSPRNDLHESYRRPWAQLIHRKVPGYRTHGLATTGGPMLLSVPWHSVDSATWIHTAAHGNIGFEVNSRLKWMAIGPKSKRQSVLDQHYESMSPERQDHWKAMVESRGFTIQQLRESFPMRAAFNLMTINRILEQEREHPSIQTTLF